MARKNLYEVAEKVVNRSIFKRWEPTTAQILKAYDLNEQQVTEVKKKAKRIAKDMGVLWGWDPKFQRFRACPENDKGSSTRMLEYSYKHWAAMGRSVSNQVRGSLAMGYLEEKTAERLIATNKEFVRGIKVLSKDAAGA